jgi:hypothetical protein
MRLSRELRVLQRPEFEARFVLFPATVDRRIDIEILSVSLSSRCQPRFLRFE